MPSIRRRTGTKYFFACFTDANGQRVQRSTKTTNRKLATKLAEEWEGVASKRATETQIRRVLSELHEQIHGSALTFYTVQTYSDQWLKAKKVECRAVTYTAYSSVLSGFLAFLGPKKDLSITYLTKDIITTWRAANAAKATARTANNKLKIIRTFLQTAWSDGLLPDGNPAAMVKVLDAADSTRRPMTIPEIKAVLAVASDSWRGMILAGLYTGQRLKDLAGLTWSNVNLQEAQIVLTTSKTRRTQFLPIAKPLLAYLEKLDSGDDPKAPIFPDLYPHAVKSGGSYRLSQQFHEILEAANLLPERSAKSTSTGKGRDGAREKSEISFHSLRHSATSLLKKAGVSESVAMDLIGHDSSEISANYTHTDDDARRAAVAKLPDITL